MGFKKHILTYTLVPMVILLSAASYYRFMVQHDYFVSYEGFCDPAKNSCYIECEDDECTAEYYYSVVTRHARVINNLCGVDITDCDAANTCLSDEEDCSLDYCDPDDEESECVTLQNSD